MRYKTLIIIVFLLVIFIGCSNLSSLKRYPKMKFGSSHVADSSALLKTDGVYTLIKNDTIFYKKSFSFKKDGLYIETFGDQTETGSYKLNHDTLILQCCNRTPGWSGSWHQDIYYLKVSGDTLNYLKYHHSIWADFDTLEMWANRPELYEKKYVYIHINEPIWIDPEEDIRRYDWMWENKEEYKAWKKAQQPK